MRTLQFIFVFICFLFLLGCHQVELNINLNFEDVKNEWPVKWSIYHQQPNYSVSLDSVNVKSGKYAMAVEFIGSISNFQILTFVLPHNYDGKKIILSGYIKTKNVTDGFAGLWLMMDPDPSYDNIELNGVKVTGTTDWVKYETTLDMYPAATKEIVIGGILTGKGKMWLDDLKVIIDGEDIKRVEPYRSECFQAKNDHEFDKGSNIIFSELSEQRINDLELLGRIWGFLKYHHPEIAKGNYNLDYELFRILPDYLIVNNRQRRDQILLKWIEKYGKISTCKIYQTTPNVSIIKPDLSWIEHSNISLKLKDILQEIYSNRNQGFQYYVKMTPYIGTPIFTNESAYEAMDYPDAGFRLLALYRYWNMIYYFFPYKHLTHKNWDSVLKEYIPYFIEAKNGLAYELSTALLIGEICDSHANLLNGWRKIELLKGSRQVSVRVQFIENQLVVMEYYTEKTENAELKKGDIITRIDGKPVEVIVDSMKRYYSTSNEAVKMRDITADILRSNKHFIQIEYISSGKTKQKEIYVGERKNWINYRFKRDTSQCYKFIGKDIGYINLNTIQAKDISVIKQKFINTKGIIIDIRNYPSGFVFNMLCPYFVSGVTPYSRHTRVNIDNPGEFIYHPFFNIINKSEEYYQGKLIVIVNEETQSGAEGMAMAFRAGDNTAIIGSTTAGALGNVSKIILPGALETQITGTNTHYPDGRETERVGIVPNTEVKPTIKGIREGRDELLEKAIEIINED